MANTIKLKRGSGSDPSASDLAVGEVALRTDNAKLFTKNDAGNVAQIGGGLSDVVDDTTPQLGGDLSVNTNNIIFGDSGGTSDDRLTFGAGTDLSIYHDGTDSAIVNSTGDLYITNNGDDLLLQGNDDVVIKTQGGADVSIQCFGNGGTELYHDNSKKFETTSSGGTLTGNLAVTGTVDGVDIASLNSTVSGKLSNVVEDSSPQLGGDLDANGYNIAVDGGNNITIGDNGRLRLGASQDLDIYHDSSNGNSHIKEGGSGSLVINADDLYLQNAAGTENLAVFVENGAVQLYYDNSKKWETTNLGTQTFGDAQFEGNDGTDNALKWDKSDDSLYFRDNIKAQFGTGGDLKIYHNGTDNYIMPSSGKLIINNGSENLAQFISNGAVELYYDNSKKFETNSAGVQVTGQLEADEIYLRDSEKIYLGTSSDLAIYHDGSNSYIDEQGTGSLNIKGSGVNIMSTSGENMIQAAQDGNVELYHNNSRKFETTARGVEITGNATGPISSLSDGSTITVDFGASCNFTVTLGGNRTFGDPDNLNSSAGSSGSIFIVQDGTGSRTASFHSDYKFAGGTAPTLSTAANAVDRLDYIVRANNDVHCVVTLDVK